MKTRGDIGGLEYGGIKCMIPVGTGCGQGCQGGQGPSRSRRERSLGVVTVMGAALPLTPPPWVCTGVRHVSMCGRGTGVHLLYNGTFSKTTERTEYYNQKLGTHPSKIQPNIPSHFLGISQGQKTLEAMWRERTSGSLLAWKDTLVGKGQRSNR